jgi:hypothetical protein
MQCPSGLLSFVRLSKSDAPRADATGDWRQRYRAAMGVVLDLIVYAIAGCGSGPRSGPRPLADANRKGSVP